MRPQQSKFFTLAFLALLFALSITTFWPGTTGGYLLDDETNLSPIQQHGGIKDLDSLRHFVFGGISGPTGRPVSMLSFVLDAQSWPVDPYSFKRTNILIHSLNGLLIFAVIFKLLRITGRNETSAIFIATFSAALWVVHPLHTSTVLYVIQRMTELVAFFTLLGVWCYLHGRQRLSRSPGPAYLWMSTSIIIFGMLATLSKENGVLLPLFILIIEFTLLCKVPRPEHWRYWAVPFLFLPTLLITAYLGHSLDNHVSSYSQREFGLYERLLTEPRALMDYLGKIIFPAHTPSLFFDDFQTSSSLLSPATTLPAIIVILTALVGSIIKYNKFPVLSFAVLWFLGGHLIESTVLPLEIYFEHRNYLPMLGILFAIAFYSEKLLSKYKKALYAYSSLIIFCLAFITWQHSHTWGDNRQLSAKLAEEQPNSPRALITHINELTKVDTKQAVAQVEILKNKFPQSLGVAVAYNDVLCQLGTLTKDKYSALLENASTLRLDSYLASSLPNLINGITRDRCKQITPKGAHKLIDKLLENHVSPPDQNKQIKLMHLKVDLFIKQRDLMSALKMLDEIFAIRPSTDIAIRQASLLTSAGIADAALRQLNKAEAIDKLRSRLVPSRQTEIEKIRLSIKSMN